MGQIAAQEAAKEVLMRLPDESISFQNTTGDSGVENLFVYGKLNYNFDNDDIKKLDQLT